MFISKVPTLKSTVVAWSLHWSHYFDKGLLLQIICLLVMWKDNQLYNVQTRHRHNSNCRRYSGFIFNFELLQLGSFTVFKKYPMHQENCDIRGLYSFKALRSWDNPNLSSVSSLISTWKEPVTYFGYNQ